jgi:hypothetical protein
MHEKNQIKVNRNIFTYLIFYRWTLWRVKIIKKMVKMVKIIQKIVF